MPRRPGIVLTQRDRQILQYLAVGRYMTGAQVHSALGDDGQVWNIGRRLKKLATPSGGRPLVRAIQYESSIPMWTLTPEGWVLAAAAVPYAKPPPRRDLTAPTLRHQELLNEVLLRFLQGVGKGPAFPIAALPFRWFAEPEEDLTFKTTNRQRLVVTSAVRPDVIVELLTRRSRVFVELETGARHVGITTGSVRNSEALVRKLHRYSDFFTGLAEVQSAETWYAKRFTDGMRPELLVIVHSVQRREAVRLAMKKWMKKASRIFEARVVTLEDAGATLASLITGAKLASERVFTIGERAALQLRERVNELLEAVNEHRDVIEAHNQRGLGPAIAIPDLPVTAMDELASLVRHDLFGEAREDVPWASLMVDPPATTR